MIGPLEINFLGTLRAPTSWAGVTRQMILALDERGHDISVTNCRGFLSSADFVLPDRLCALMDKPRHTAFEIAFDYPPNYYKLMAEKHVGMLVYETTALPTHWRDAILEYLHLLIVPSRFCVDIMVSAGIPEGMVTVVPYGIDPELFHPNAPAVDLPTTKSFKFLCVAMPHKRKALDILLKAYCSEFSASDDVCLVIKSSYRPKSGKLRPWEIEFETIIAGFSKKNGAPEIAHICEPTPTVNMPGFYTACDCYAQPSRSEGFGMAILEAFACGKMAIVTGWSGHMDFCADSNSFLLDYTIEPANDIQYDNDSTEALAAVPDVEHLQKLMRLAYEDRETLDRKSKAAIKTASAYTWAAAAEKMEKALLQLKEQP